MDVADRKGSAVSDTVELNESYITDRGLVIMFALVLFVLVVFAARAQQGEVGPLFYSSVSSGAALCFWAAFKLSRLGVALTPRGFVLRGFLTEAVVPYHRVVEIETEHRIQLALTDGRRRTVPGFTNVPDTRLARAMYGTSAQRALRAMNQVLAEGHRRPPPEEEPPPERTRYDLAAFVVPLVSFLVIAWGSHYSLSP